MLMTSAINPTDQDSWNSVIVLGEVGMLKRVPSSAMIDANEIVDKMDANWNKRSTSFGYRKQPAHNPHRTSL